MGIDLDSGLHFASIPVSNGVVDYEEYFVLTDEQYEEFLDEPAVAVVFIEDCRRRLHDELLMVKPGSNRGIAV